MRSGRERSRTGLCCTTNLCWFVFRRGNEPKEDRRDVCTDCQMFYSVSLKTLILQFVSFIYSSKGDYRRTRPCLEWGNNSSDLRYNLLYPRRTKCVKNRLVLVALYRFIFSASNGRFLEPLRLKVDHRILTTSNLSLCQDQYYEWAIFLPLLPSDSLLLSLHLGYTRCCNRSK